MSTFGTTAGVLSNYNLQETFVSPKREICFRLNEKYTYLLIIVTKRQNEKI